MSNRYLVEEDTESEKLIYPSRQKIKGLVNVQYSQTTSVPTNHLSFIETNVSAANVANTSDNTRVSAESFTQ